ncbi:MAG: Crp/Fnr family transcriptional regulator [Burkholderiales bacterium]|jgi:CRP/FNR family transcriptional regulator|nr:Crp/Fnr family transcriptional regulator [Burkholderiales bacterium]
MTFINYDNQKACCLLRGYCWLHLLPENEIVQLAVRSQWRHFVKGEMLFYEGKKMLNCFLLDSGCVEVFRYTAKGTEKNFGHIRSKEALALAAVFMDHERFPMNGRAYEDGCALQIPNVAIRDLCMRYPEVSLRLLNIFCNRLYSMVNQIDWLTSSSATERLADYLLRLCSNCPKDCTLRLPLNRMQLATRLGVRQETLSRLISEWQKCGYIASSGKHIRILNVDALQQLAKSAQRSF